jgi:hypothetical protein
MKAEHLRALVAATGSLEAAASIGANVVPGVHLPNAARGFLAQPDEAAIDADVAWIEANNAALIPCTSPEFFVG